MNKKNNYGYRWNGGGCGETCLQTPGMYMKIQNIRFHLPQLVQLSGRARTFSRLMMKTLVCKAETPSSGSIDCWRQTGHVTDSDSEGITLLKHCSQKVCRHGSTYRDGNGLLINNKLKDAYVYSK